MGIHLITGFLPDCPSHLSSHSLLLSESWNSLHSLKSFPRPLESTLLRVTERVSWKCWTSNCVWEVLRVQRLGEMEGVILLPSHLHVSSASHCVQIFSLKSAFTLDTPSQERTHRFSSFLSFSFFPKCELNLRRQAAPPIKTSFAVNVNCSNNKMA